LKYQNQLTPQSPLFPEEILKVGSAERGSGYVDEVIVNEGRVSWIKIKIELKK
jgi:hypothetical protein